MNSESKFKIGDLVYYRPVKDNRYADGTRQLGVVVEVIRDQPPLFLSFPEKEIFEFEYKVVWINTGYSSKLLYFNLEKLESPPKE